MKKYKFIICTIIFLVSVSISSCKRNFEALNTNPNTSDHALPQALLAPAIASVVSANMNRAQRITNELMQVTVNMGDTDGKIFRYDILAPEADYMWNSWYLQLANFNDVYQGGVDNASPTYQGIALICEAWIYSMLTDTYGDVPFTQAGQAKNGLFTPAFDKQELIYTGIFQALEKANTLLTSGTNVLAASDPIYAGNAAAWRKFGNSLYLRLLLRVSAKASLNTPAKIKEMIDTKASTYPLMGSNNDSAILKWNGVSPYVSPFATWRAADWYTPKLASFFVDNLNEWSDPRIAKWATVVNGGYSGVPSGYAVGQAPAAQSTLVTPLQTEALLGNVMNYGELQLILAECAIKGYTAKSAQTYYETGVTNAIAMWGYTLPTNYLTYQLVKWDDTYTLDHKMELIHLQKYYAMFFTDFEQWFEYRRTGHPVLPKGAGLKNGGVMPARLNYPVYVQSTNSENYNAAVASQGPDKISTQVWWQKP